MTEYDYINQINVYEDNIKQYQSKINSLKKELQEAEESLHEARQYSTRFYDALDNKKAKRNELSVSNCLKALISWTNQLDDLFRGSSFVKADNSIQSMIANIKEEIRRLCDELDYYEELLGTTEDRLSSTRTELNNYRRAEAARQEAARQEAARQEAARQEAARQEAARQEAARQEAQKKQNKPSSASSSKSTKKKNDNLLDNIIDFFR